MKRISSIFALLGIFACALSTSSTWKTFQEKYKTQPDSNLGKATCTICHVGKHGGRLNPYGKDLQAVMKDAGLKKATAETLAKIEKLDSLKSGKTNIEKIKADVNPGQ